MVFQTGNALFYCNLLNEIRLLHISVFRIRDNVIWCVCQNQGGGGVGGVSAVTVSLQTLRENFFLRKIALLRPVTTAARISPTCPCFPQHGDPHSDSAAPRWCVAIQFLRLWTPDQAAERTHGRRATPVSTFPNEGKLRLVVEFSSSKGGEIKKCAAVMLEIDPLNFLGSVHAEFFVCFRSLIYKFLL